MKKTRTTNYKLTRREFLSTLGATTAGMTLAPFITSRHTGAYARGTTLLAQVAVTQSDNYGRAFIKQKVQHLFESIGGIGDVVKPGDRVAIKLNLTGGSYWAFHQDLQGVDIRDCMWTHPEVVRAVGELIIDCGVSGDDLYIVEALWDDASYNNFGYRDVQQGLGAQKVNLNESAPYAEFIDKEVGENRFYYESFRFNPILTDVDVYVSIPKMKQHYSAGVTHSIKNQIGIVPLEAYKQTPFDGNRTKLHFDGGDVNTHLPRSICDLFFARPVNLAIIDGIKNAEGGEGGWNDTFRPAEYHVMLAGKESVATDSVASYLMGNDPEAEKLQLPGGGQCDNYLELLHQKGMGTNRMSEIEIVGDGASLVTFVHSDETATWGGYRLHPNYPNPFNFSTLIRYDLPRAGHVTMKIYNMAGREVETLVEGRVPEGRHEIRWSANRLPAGAYLCRIQTGRFSDTRRLIYQK